MPTSRPLTRALAPTLLEPLPHIGNLRDKVEMVTWSDVVEEPLGVALERRFTHDLVRGLVGTDGLIGTFASLHDPSLVQNRCFLFHRLGNGTGEWRVPVGGMGTVTAELERVAREAGADLRTGCTVERIEVTDDSVSVTGEGFEVVADHVLSGVAPYVLAGLLGDPLPPRPSGSQFKINLLVSRLPRLRSGHDPEVAFAGTLHVNEAMSQLEELHAAASRGEAPFASGEVYCHTLTDRSILGPELADSDAQTLTYFGLHTPYENLLDDATGEAAYRQVLACAGRLPGRTARTPHPRRGAQDARPGGGRAGDAGRQHLPRRHRLAVARGGREAAHAGPTMGRRDVPRPRPDVRQWSPSGRQRQRHLGPSRCPRAARDSRLTSRSC